MRNDDLFDDIAANQAAVEDIEKKLATAREAYFDALIGEPQLITRRKGELAAMEAERSRLLGYDVLSRLCEDRAETARHGAMLALPDEAPAGLVEIRETPPAADRVGFKSGRVRKPKWCRESYIDLAYAVGEATGALLSMGCIIGLALAFFALGA